MLTKFEADISTVRRFNIMENKFKSFLSLHWVALVHVIIWFANSRHFLFLFSGSMYKTINSIKYNQMMPMKDFHQKIKVKTKREQRQHEFCWTIFQIYQNCYHYIFCSLCFFISLFSVDVFDSFFSSLLLFCFWSVMSSFHEAIWKMETNAFNQINVSPTFFRQIFMVHHDFHFEYIY